MNFVRASEYLEVAAEDTYTVASGQPLAVDLTDILGEATIASVDSITPTPTGLTLENAAANAQAYTDEGTTIAIGKGVLFDKTGGSAGKSYLVRIVVTLSNGLKRGAEFRIQVE